MSGRELGTSTTSLMLGPIRRYADGLGIGLSGLCVVHCLLTPVAIALVPSIHFHDYHDVVHDWLLVILPVIALGAFVPGYRRHKDKRVFLYSAPGILFIALGAILFHGNMECGRLTGEMSFRV